MNKKKTQGRKVVRPRNKQRRAKRSENYDIVSALINSQTGVTFRYLWKVDAATAQKELERILGKGGLKVGVISDDPNKEGEQVEDKYLVVAFIKIHGIDFYALMDSSAIRNVVNLNVVDGLSLDLEDTKKVITVATGEKSGVLGKIYSILVAFDNVRATLDFVVIEKLVFDVVIGRPTIKSLGGL